MSSIWCRYGAYYMTVRYVEWRSGLAYFRRRIPSDVQKYYPRRKGFEFFSLRTRDRVVAAKKAHAEALRLDREWELLRSGNRTTAATRAAAKAILAKHNLEPGQWREHQEFTGPADAFLDELRYLSANDEEPDQIVKENLSPEYLLAAELFHADPGELDSLMVPLLSEVVARHVEFEPRRKVDDQFHRAIDRFVTVNGDLPIDQYRRLHGNDYVSDMIQSGLAPATVKRYLAQVRPVFETAIIELEVGMSNPLAKLKIPEPDKDEDGGRSPFSMQQIKAIQSQCREVDDERRWLIAVLSDTGGRLAEIAGLLRSEVNLEGPFPHLVVQTNSLRGLKTSASKRLIPLVGEAYWGAQRALERSSGDALFSGLIPQGSFNSASISASLNKWLKIRGLRNDDQPIHSLRHSFRDRLRNAEIPTDVQDRLGGWATRGVGESYGAGHGLELLWRHMKKAMVGEM